MTEKEILISQTSNAYDWTNKLIETIPLEKWEIIPDTIESSISWQVGHLIISHYFHSIMAALLAFGKNRLNIQFNFMSKMSRCAFAVYILHPFVLIVLSLLLKDWAIDPAIKFLIVAPLGVIASFLLGYVVVKIPGVNQVV